MAVEAVLALPARLWVAPLRAAFGKEVEGDKVALGQTLNHFGTRIDLPGLHDPGRVGIAALHGAQNSLPGGVEVHAGRVAALVEGVHGVVVGLAVEARQLVVVELGDFSKARVRRLQEGRPAVGAPESRGGHVEAQLLAGVVGQHARVTRQYGLDVQLAHPAHDALLKGLLLAVPVFRVGASPSLKVVHEPPSLKGGAGYESVDFVRRIAQFVEHVAPNDVRSGQRQWQVDAVERHPVYFLLPALPVPEGHRIGERAVVQVVAQVEVGLVALRSGDVGQCFGQVGVHAVPREVYVGVMLQIPVQSRSQRDVVVAAYDDLVAPLVELEEVLVGLYLLEYEFFRGALVDAVCQFFNRRSRVCGQTQAEHGGDADVSHAGNVDV